MTIERGDIIGVILGKENISKMTHSWILIPYLMGA